jgi:hypothetical protein
MAVSKMSVIPNPFVLFAQARSGSTVLFRILQLHPQLHIALEPFHHKYHSWNPEEPNYVDFIVDIPSLEEQLVVLFSKYDGFKVLDYQLPTDIYTHLLLRPDIKVIALRRRNILQQAVSGFIAEQTGVWQKRDMTGDVTDVYKRLEPIDLNNLKANIEYRLEVSRYYLEVLSRKPSEMCSCLYYEDLYTSNMARNRESIRGIFYFLGLCMHDNPKLDELLDPRVEKINSALTYALLPNARVIDEKFGSEELGWLFENEQSM